MNKIYDKFFETSKLFDQFVQEQKWSKVKNKAEFKSIIESEFRFWERILTMMPPERRLLEEFSWFKQCYEQITKNLSLETENWKLYWLHEKNDDF